VSPLRAFRELLGRYLLGVFRATERLNRDAILESLAGVSGNSLLDCGCGDGQFTVELAATVGAESIYGIEWDLERLRDADSNRVAAIRADLNEAWPFEDDSFDVVHSNQVIEHLHSTDKFLRETRRVLKPGGVAVLSTNNMASWHNVASLVMGLQPPPMHVSSEIIAGNPLDPLSGSRHPTAGDSHLRLFSFRGLRDLLEYHRFRVRALVSVGYYPLPPTAAKVATRIDRWHGAFLVATLTKVGVSAGSTDSEW
jgi:SAM-dependent methyltransferase